MCRSEGTTTAWPSDETGNSSVAPCSAARNRIRPAPSIRASMLDAAMAVSAAINQQMRLGARPVGRPKPTDFTRTEEPVAHPGDGEFLVKVLYISLDPAMRGWLNEGRSYIRPVAVGDVMRAIAVGEVIE